MEDLEKDTFVEMAAIRHNKKTSLYEIVIFSLNENTMEVELLEKIPVDKNKNRAILEFRKVKGKRKIIH